MEHERGIDGRARVCMVTHPADGATAFARRLVEERLAACVNVLPATSVFRWEGTVQEDAECLLVIKTLDSLVGDLERYLRAEHPYDVPECLALEPASVEESYLAWMRAETRGSAR